MATIVPFTCIRQVSDTNITKKYLKRKIGTYLCLSFADEVTIADVEVVDDDDEDEEYV